MTSNLRASAYNFHFSHKDTPYIYNILSTSLIEVDDQLDAQLKNNSIDEISADFIPELRDGHFIVEGTNHAEHDEYMYFYNKTRFCNSNKTFVLTLIPSYSCNLACPYCMQGQEKDNGIISKEKLSSLYAFINKKIKINKTENKEFESLVIRFYGGEPLLQKRAIADACATTSAMASENNIGIRYDMPTNLTVLDEESIALLKKYNISIQVSIDGPKDLHDKRRYTKKREGTYDTITANLKKLCECGLRENITIRINIDADNITRAEECLMSVAQYAGHVYFGMLAPYSGFNDGFAPSCINCDEYSNHMATHLNRILIQNGYEAPQMFGKQTPCSLNSDNKFFVDDRLDVYKCEILVNNKDFCVGTISDDGSLDYNNNFFHQMNFSPSNFEECISCKLLPMCGSGCPAKAYIANSDTHGTLKRKSCTYTESDLLNYLRFYIEP